MNKSDTNWHVTFEIGVNHKNLEFFPIAEVQNFQKISKIDHLMAFWKFANLVLEKSQYLVYFAALYLRAQETCKVELDEFQSGKYYIFWNE